MMDDTKIREIIEKHQHWLRADCYGWEEMRADLSKTDLSGASLRWTNLFGANLCGADLRGTDLCNADLCRADLNRADLRGSNLCGADLHEANLYRANLHGADLRKADLYGAILYEANLRESDLYEADLREANLYGAFMLGADLREANLFGADLLGADLRGANNIPFIPYTCPDFGAFTGFKKAHDLIVVLEIPEDARRLSATGRKCRCDKAKVIDIQNVDGTKANVTSVSSDSDNDFVYKIGEEVRVLDFDENRWNECSTGIHFFINRQEAVNYG